jgi:predicted Zn-dependent protease
VVVFRDRGTGRGDASFLVGDESISAIGELAREAAERAAVGGGPGWSLPQPAAPARVATADDWLASHLPAGADAIAGQLSSHLPDGYRLASAYLEVCRDNIAVATSNGFSSDYLGTRVHTSANIADPDGRPGEIERVVRYARRIEDLELSKELPAAAAHLADRRAAVPTPPGTYNVALSGAAITCESAIPGQAEHFGWFAPFVAQASGSSARQGLSRYQPGQPVFGAAPTGGDPISLSSDGTLGFGLRSAPFGPHGEPIRKFDLVRKGVAAGLALDLREAGLRKTTANGGVRNLVVASGSTRSADLVELASLEVEELRWLEVDPSDGKVVAEIGLGYTRNGTERTPVVGGVITGNVFAMLARARLSANRTLRGWYKGPSLIWMPDVTVQ